MSAPRGPVNHRARPERSAEGKTCHALEAPDRCGAGGKEQDASLGRLGDAGAILLHRFAVSGLLPVSWFRRVDPARVPRSKRRGRLHLEIVSHCWRYGHLLVYQLSSLVHHRSTRLDITMSVYYCPEDEATRRVLRFFGDLRVPGITWDWRALPKESLFRRAIGRNLAAKRTEADWIWFTDADIVFQEGCLDTLAGLLQGRDEALLFPETMLRSALLPDGHALLRRGREGPALLRAPPETFTLRRGPVDRALGPCQITHGDIARACGYCEAIPLFQRPVRGWRKCLDDALFRWVLDTPGHPLDLPGVCQIRHLAKGRYGEAAPWLAGVRTVLRQAQDRRSRQARSS